MDKNPISPDKKMIRCPSCNKEIFDTRVWQGCHMLPITTGRRVWVTKDFCLLWVFPK